MASSISGVMTQIAPMRNVIQRLNADVIVSKFTVPCCMLGGIVSAKSRCY
jgi:hypothetical protein